mgnify:CR=1 FL=1
MDKEAAKELELLKRLKAHLEDGKPASTFEPDNEDEEGFMKEYNLLTGKNRLSMRPMYPKMTWQTMRSPILMYKR